MIRELLAGMVLLLIVIRSGVAADFRQEVQSAYSEFNSALGNPGPFILEGRLQELSEKAVGIFPADTRSGAQALVLGNALFDFDPKAAYALHKEAVAKLPDEANAHLEWAMEQHRTGEFAGAAESYARYLQDNPEFALAWGLLAECRLQGGDIRAAVDAWKRSEAASIGTLVQFETFVCQVHTRKSLLWERAELSGKSKGGDIDAAERLIALDCDFERDWWNGGPHQDFLTYDLQFLQKIEFKDKDRILEVLCAGEAAIASLAEPKKVAEILRRRGLLCDEVHTLPRSNRLLAPLIAAAEGSQAVAQAQARDYWGTKIWERAKASQDAEVYNVAAHLYLDSPELVEIQQQGWDATHDERFAVACLLRLAEKNQLDLKQADLVQAANLFPKNSIVAQIQLELAEDAKEPLEPYLVQAILAEYSRFIARGAIAPPSARILRSYFSRLDKELGARQ